MDIRGNDLYVTFGQPTQNEIEKWNKWEYEKKFPKEATQIYTQVPSKKRRLKGDKRWGHGLPKSPHKLASMFIQWDSMILSDRNRKQVLIPPGVGNGFLVLSDHSVFHYKWSYEGEYADVDEQFTIKWNDERLNIDWPIDNPILQTRDK